MDLSLIIISTICLLLFILLLVLANKSKKKKQARFLDPLNSLAESANCRISTHNIWNNSVIGFDETRHFIFAIHGTKTGRVELAINLAEIFRCKVSEISRSSGPKDGNLKIFDRIDLVFVNKDKNKADIVVPFYDAGIDRLTLAGELQLAEKWCVLANNGIAKIGK
jgi:hypothetical protein